MTHRTLVRKLLVVTAVATAGSLALAANALAGVATYPSSGTFGVPNNTGQAGIPSQVFVPPGRTAVQSLQLTKVMPSFGGGGGGDLQLRLKSPSGTEIDVISIGCTNYPNTSAFTVSDNATLSLDSPAFCTALGLAPTTAAGKPSEPLSTFNGTPSAGVWTVTVVDVGVSGILGSWNGWSLEVTHANPKLTATKALGLKVPKKFAISATCDANCAVTTGGDAKPTTIKVAQGGAGLIIASPTKKAKKKLASGKKASIQLTAIDETGGTTTATVKSKLG